MANHLFPYSVRGAGNGLRLLIMVAGVGLWATAVAAGEKTSVKFNAETSYFGNPIDSNFGEFRIYVDGDLLMTIGASQKKSSIKHGMPTGPHELKAEYYCLGSTYSSTRTINVQDNDLVEMKMLFKGQSWEFGVELESASRPAMVKAVVNLDPEVFEREVASETVKTPKGTKRTVKRSRTIEHSVSLTTRESTELGASVDLLNVLNLEVRRKVEEESSRSLKKSETVEQSIEIDGAELPVLRLVWVERYRKGRADVTIDGASKKLEFLFPMELELRPEEVASPKD
ncbi:MAG: hypothetical protein SFX72_11690 [Isosphaeraceae bacterium]|nr:hypothetical protein [Isosphaeraceae bacterium]